MSAWLGASLLGALQLGCTGDIVGESGAPGAGGPGGVTPNAADSPGITVNGKVCSEAKLLPARIWRLTSQQYLQSARELLSLETLPDIELEIEPVVNGFKNNANALSVTTRVAEQLQRAAVSLSASGVQQFARYSGCAATAFADQACVQSFITAFGARAFRRPLKADEVAGYLAVYQAGVADDGGVNGVRLVIQTLLQSPHFLYRTELGDETPARAVGVVQLNGFELASALSFSLWGSPPDDALLASAASGSLQSSTELVAQARRLLADPRARPAMANFAAQWLAVQDPNVLLRDPLKFPEFAGVKGAMFQEFQLLAQESLLGAGATLGSMFSSGQSFLSKPLADFYGVSGSALDATFKSTSLANTPRVGLLTSGALIASWSRDEDTAPMTRGKHLLHRVLCQALPPPPASLDIPAVPKLDNATTRERYAIHSQNPGCASCHDTLDSVAFALENFDSVGRYRTTENGKPIDASGSISGTSDLDGPFADAKDLAARLAGSQSARACFAQQYVRFAGGAGERGDNECLTQGLVSAAAANGDSPTALMLALVESEFFRARQAQ